MARFIPESFRVSEGFSFLGKISVQGKAHDVRINMAYFFWQIPKFFRQFSSYQEFGRYCMSRWRPVGRGHLKSDEKYAVTSSVMLNKSSGDRLVIDCAIAKTLSGRGETVLNPYQLANAFDMNFLGPLEIAYIGRTCDGAWNRLYNHNKWGLIEDRRGVEEELLVYFMQLDCSEITSLEATDYLFVKNDHSPLPVRHVTEVTEAALIAHFMCDEGYNVKLVGADIRKTRAAKNVLRGCGYDSLVCEVKLESPLGRIGTKAVGMWGHHQIEYEI